MAEPTAHTEAPAEHHEFPPFVTHHFPSQILWLALTFVLLYVLMSRVALPRIGAILADRQRRIAGDLAAAQRFKEQSEIADAAYFLGFDGLFVPNARWPCTNAVLFTGRIEPASLSIESTEPDPVDRQRWRRRNRVSGNARGSGRA